MTYPAFGKIPRLNREVIITEKIDGTNGLVSIEAHPFGHGAAEAIPDDVRICFAGDDGTGMPIQELWVRAGSRNRWISPDRDNYGFAAWVHYNAATLAATLGEGLHYGEWWGLGIQRGYGVLGKRFSLFNAGRWTEEVVSVVPDLHVVPTLIHGYLDDVPAAVRELRINGSLASPGFDRPEGVIVYHTAARSYFKVTLDNDAKHKGE